MTEWCLSCQKGGDLLRAEIHQTSPSTQQLVLERKENLTGNKLNRQKGKAVFAMVTKICPYLDLFC